jgi:hypothetical protein
MVDVVEMVAKRPTKQIKVLNTSDPGVIVRRGSHANANA